MKVRFFSTCCLVLAGQSEYSNMPPVQSGPPGNIPLPLPDLSRPPPGFPPGPGFGPGPTNLPPQPPPLMSLALKPPQQDTELMPSMPYYDLPAGLMAPLVKVCFTPLSSFCADKCPCMKCYGTALPIGNSITK